MKFFISLFIVLLSFLGTASPLNSVNTAEKQTELSVHFDKGRKAAKKRARRGRKMNKKRKRKCGQWGKRSYAG